MTYTYGDEKIRNLHKNIQKRIIAIDDLLINIMNIKLFESIY